MSVNLGPKKRKARTIHRYPNGNDPKKRKLFGNSRRCSKCSRTKDIFNFNWKSDYYKGKRKIRLQAECSDCREKQRRLKYSESPEIFLMRAYKIQKEKHGLICPLSGQVMTHQQGHGPLETNISIDRIDSLKNYDPGNIQFICRRVNTMKHNETTESLVSWSRAIMENHDL